MFTGLASLAHKLKFLANENSTTILTGMGVTGTVATAYLTGRATFKAAEIIAEAQKVETETDLDIPMEDGSFIPGTTKVELDLSLLTKIKLVWRHYIPPCSIGLVTITCILVANKIASKKIAALTVASGISERALQEYKAKVVEKLGERQDQKLRDEVAQDRVSNNPVTSQELVVTSTGDVLCMDMLTGRYFHSTMENIKRAENKINHQLLQHMDASLSEFFDELGLTPTSYSDSVGWNAANMVEVKISTTMSADQRPCLAVDFQPHPFSTYSQLHG